MNILIVDMLEGFTRQGILASPRVAALIPKQVEFLRKVPQDSFILLACDRHEPGDSELKRLPPHCMSGTPEMQICPEIMEVIHERGLQHHIIYKSTHSAFFQTDIETGIEMGERYGGDEWVVFGCVTDICITANVMELDYRGKTVILVRDLIDTYQITSEQAWSLGKVSMTHDPDVYNNLFFDYYLPGVWGARIVTAADLI